MSEDLAVVLDVAGTMLRMYRVAKDLRKGVLMKSVITIELIMERVGRALVVPNVEPTVVGSLDPDLPLRSLVDGREDMVEISCSSTPVSVEEALSIIQRSEAKVADLQEVHRAVISRCPDTYQTSGLVVDSEVKTVTYTLSTGGVPYPGLEDVLMELRKMGAGIYVASGDSIQSLLHLRNYGIPRDRIHPVSSPRRKEEIVRGLKGRYKRVIMVGDGMNDLYAFRAADWGVLTVQQDSRPPKRLLDTADRVIGDIRELPEIIINVSGRSGSELRPQSP